MSTETVETEEYVEPDYKKPVGKAPTALQARFAEWLQSDAVGYNPQAAKSKVEAFNEGVRLAVALRIPFQASDFNREATLVEREERAALRAEQERQREADRAAAKAAEPVEEAPAPKPAPKAKATKAAKATPAATPATAPAATRPAARRAPARRPATATATAGDAPF